MPERIIGQCNTADFRAIEHLVNVYGTEAFDPTTITKKQKLALMLVVGFRAAGLKFEDCYRIKEVLFWEHRIEFKFMPVPESRNLRSKLSKQGVSSTIMNRIAELLKGGE